MNFARERWDRSIQMDAEAEVIEAQIRTMRQRTQGLGPAATHSINDECTRLSYEAKSLREQAASYRADGEPPPPPPGPRRAGPGDEVSWTEFGAKRTGTVTRVQGRKTWVLPVRLDGKPATVDRLAPVNYTILRVAEANR